MKTRRTSLKIFIAAMMAVVLMVSFAMPAFADDNEGTTMTVYVIDYCDIITSGSMFVYNADNDAIGHIMIYVVQMGINTLYINYEIALTDGKTSDLMACKITRYDADNASNTKFAEIPLENSFCTGDDDTMGKILYNVPFSPVTDHIEAELTIFYYNAETSLLEMYRTSFTFEFGTISIRPIPDFYSIKRAWYVS